MCASRHHDKYALAGIHRDKNYNRLGNMERDKKEKKKGRIWTDGPDRVEIPVYGIDLLYSLPSSASLYNSATYGFFAGVSAPSSTNLAYTLTT
jgi:hypothetical protein